jgi:hypothetical protein
VLRLHIGNHDLDLVWPSVQAHLRTVLRPGNLDALQFTTTFACYHGVHIEHGHMFTPENATDDAVAFIHEWPQGGCVRTRATRARSLTWSFGLGLRCCEDPH